ncbi:MAG: type III pantothenate kinase [Methylococcales symbiont of Hymedesmia sp. n. MRB-2018]|nr:MAG: type III pantothenate kinase [Methylococcales symbiont of Hymedesmia sp. n. MRB-2018]
MNLLLDIGNTRVKWGIDNGEGELRTSFAIEHKKAGFSQAIKEQWQSLKKPDKLVISSVSSTQIVQQVLAIADVLWPEIKVIIAETSAQSFSVTNAYSQPEKLGIDRWLSLIALQHYYPGNSVVVDCGTAITIDAINEKGQHLGGIISPGLQLMKQALSQNTEALRLSETQFTATLSNTTEAAIYTGTLYAVAGLIEKTMDKLCQSNLWVLTGGDAQLLAPYLKIKCIVEVDFVLKGLSLYCQERRE